jgi:hypothetical protein
VEGYFAEEIVYDLLSKLFKSENLIIFSDLNQKNQSLFLIWKNICIFALKNDSKNAASKYQ